MSEGVIVAFLDADSRTANEQKFEQRYETAFVSLPYRRRFFHREKPSGFRTRNIRIPAKSKKTGASAQKGRINPSMESSEMIHDKKNKARGRIGHSGIQHAEYISKSFLWQVFEFPLELQLG